MMTIEVDGRKRVFIVAFEAYEPDDGGYPIIEVESIYDAVVGRELIHSMLVTATMYEAIVEKCENEAMDDEVGGYDYE